jgi:hypothetical protein
VIGVLLQLVADGIEEPPIDGAGPLSDAFRMKDRVAEETSRPGGVEAVVLVDGDVMLSRDLTAPSVIAGNPV